MTKKLDKSLLDDWAELNSQIMGLSEADVWALLTHERTHRRRHQVMMRLHSRANKLRASRERVALITEPK